MEHLEILYAAFARKPKNEGITYESWLKANIFTLSELNLEQKVRITNLEKQVEHWRNKYAKMT